MLVGELERVLRERRVKLVYVVPDFHNPNGTTLSLARRLALLELARRHDFAIVEDSAYSELRFRGEHLPSLAALDEAAVVFHLGTFSKTLAPGLRIGWIRSPHREAMRALVSAKQAADLHNATLAQRAVATLLETFDFDGHLGRVRDAYRKRCEAMVATLAEFPSVIRWTRPDGGMFVWVELAAGIVADDLVDRAAESLIAFVPGSSFLTDHAPSPYLRLSFSNHQADLIAEGTRRFGHLVTAASRTCTKA